jgi:L-2-hydroxyglutarate oxidase LhgO
VLIGKIRQGPGIQVATRCRRTIGQRSPRAVAQLSTDLRMEQPKLVAATSEDEYASMAHRVLDAQQMQRYLAGRAHVEAEPVSP